MIDVDMLIRPAALGFFGVVIHLVADWIFQSEWMALNKGSLRHPAAWVHSGIHALALLLIFPPAVALVVGIVHLLVDIRVPLIWWRRVYRQTTDGPFAMHVAIWGDQVCHIAVIAVAALYVGGAI